MKYKEFKTGDYIKAQEDGSLYIVGNKKNIVAAFYNDKYHLFDSATDYINYNYKTNEVIGDFEYCSDKEIEIINNEMKEQRRVFVKEWGVCVPEFILNFKPHDVLISECGNRDEYIILKNIEISVDDGIPTFKIKPYLYVESGYRYYYEDIPPSFSKDDLEYDADIISLYRLINIDEMLHNFYLYDIHYNEEKDSYEYTSYEEEIYDELYDEDDDCFVDSIEDIKSIFDAKMYVEYHSIDENLKKFLNCEQLSDYELDGEVSLGDIVPDESVEVDFELLYDEDFFKILKDKDKTLISMTLDGYSRTDIARVLNCGEDYITKRRRLLKQKWREFNGRN